MTLTVNGDKKEVPGGATLAPLLQSLNLVTGRLACEVNRDVVRRADYDKVHLKDGDAVEIVQMIGGG